MFELFKSEKNEKYYWNLKAGNGQIILSSQGYADKAGATNGIDSVKKNCSDANCFETKETANGKIHFSLKSTNGQVIGSSQMYADMGGANNGIESVKKNAPSADVKDLTA